MTEFDETLSGTSDANGNGRLTFRAQGFDWELRQVSASAPDIGNSAEGKSYLDGAFHCDFIPQSDAITEPPSVRVRVGHAFHVVWTNGEPNVSLEATAYYDRAV